MWIVKKQTFRKWGTPVFDQYCSGILSLIRHSPTYRYVSYECWLGVKDQNHSFGNRLLALQSTVAAGLARTLAKVVWSLQCTVDIFFHMPQHVWFWYRDTEPVQYLFLYWGVGVLWILWLTLNPAVFEQFIRFWSPCCFRKSISPSFSWSCKHFS